VSTLTADIFGATSAPTVTDTSDVDFERRLSDEMLRERIRREARRRLDTEARRPTSPIEVLTLRERLARPADPVTYRIEGWQPLNSRVILAAQFKAGKTTLVGNHIRSLADGDNWLGQHPVAPVEGTVVLLDFEMSPRQLDAWLRDQRIMHDDRVIAIPMRGSARAFDILNDDIRAEWAQRLRNHQAGYLIVDCLRPILDALGLDEHHDAGRFLVAFDELLHEAGIDDALVVHHMGHTNERSRGDSRLRDWPDVEWRLVRQSEDPASPRFLTAYGRDVDMSERKLAYDADTRRLTIDGGSRHDAAKRETLDDVLSVLREVPEPLAQTHLVERVRQGGERPRKQIREAIALGIANGDIVTEPGPRRALLHKCAPARRSTPQYAGTVGVSSTPSLKDGVLTHSDSQGAPVRQDGGHPDDERF